MENSIFNKIFVHWSIEDCVEWAKTNFSEEISEKFQGIINNNGYFNLFTSVGFQHKTRKKTLDILSDILSDI